MSKFRVGDRVIVKSSLINKCEPKGLGFVCVTADDGIIGIEFDSKVAGGHECSFNFKNSKCKFGHGWWCSEDYVELLDGGEQDAY